MVLHCDSCGWTKCRPHPTPFDGLPPVWVCEFMARAGHIRVALTADQRREFGL